MTTPARRCTECGKPLSGDARQVTCSPAHRQARARRLRREASRKSRDKTKGATPGTRDSIRGIVEKQTDDVIRATFVEELRPVVREAIDEDAVRAIKGMVGLAPAAILVLQEDLASKDPVLRQRAAALVVKYTLGNPAATPPREDGGGQVTIINQLPRPERAPVGALPESARLPEQATPAIDATADELRRCDTCNLDKPLAAFPADGPRCETCLANRKAEVLAAYTPPDDALRERPTAEDVQRPSGSGGPEVHQAGAGLQPGLVRPPRLDQVRPQDQARPQAGSSTFGGPDPYRFSNGRD